MMRGCGVCWVFCWGIYIGQQDGGKGDGSGIITLGVQVLYFGVG